MVAVRNEKSVLDWLRRRRQKDGRQMISEIEYRAGDRIRRDFWQARMTPSITTNYCSASGGTNSSFGGDRALNLQQAALDARERVRMALDAVGSDYSNLLIDICCLDKKLTDVELHSGWPKRSGKLILQFALRQLARHYKMDRQAPIAHVMEDTIRHWGSDNYRPNIEFDWEQTTSTDD